MPQTSFVIALTVATLLLHPEAAAAKSEIRLTSSEGALFVAESLAAGVDIAPNQFLLPINLPNRREQWFSKLSFSFTEADQGRIAAIPFDLSNIKATVRSSRNVRDRIGIKTAWIDETGTLWVEFNQPIRSGTAITLALHSEQFPAGTTFRYGIAAYPTTRNSAPIFVGDGILNNRLVR